MLRFIKPLDGGYDLILAANRVNMKILRRKHVPASPPDQEGTQHAVLICVAYPVESPEKIIPSFVWLEPAKERLHFIREIYKDAMLLKGFSILDKRESRFALPDSQSHKRIHRQVKGCSKVAHSVSRHGFQVFRERFGNLSLDHFIKSVKVQNFNGSGVGLRFGKGQNFLLEVNNVILTLFASELCIFKLISHGLTSCRETHI